MRYVIISMNNSIGLPFKNINGSIIRRSKFGVGKLMGSRIYIHKNYANEVLDKDLLEKAKSFLPKDFNYNCISFDFKIPSQVRFDEAPDFDTSREPIPGKMITVDTNTGKYKISFSNQIWHHKWEWVKNEYKGFDVEESYNWSKKWASKIDKISGIGSKNVWKNKLKDFGLE